MVEEVKEKKTEDNMVEEVKEKKTEENSEALTGAIQSLREDLNNLKEENVLLKQQLQTPPAELKKSGEDESDDDIVTKGELKHIIAQFEAKNEAGRAELAVRTKYPDYDEVITKKLPEILKTNPKLLVDPYETAYQLAKLQEKNGEIDVEAAKKIIENAAKVKTPTGGSAQAGPEDVINNMSDTEFNEYINTIKNK